MAKGPKMKTDSGTKKRFKLTGSGKIVRRKSFRSHLMEKKSNTRRRRLAREMTLGGAQERRVKRLLGM
jgi:large subunit ribosomal protein L35